MNEENTQYLYKKYPKIYAHKDLPTIESLMCFGFQCSDGWFWLIDKISEHIQEYIDNNKHLNIPQVTAEEVKSKYGTLRYYYAGGNDYISGLVSQTEKLTEYICEECGAHQQEKTLWNKGCWVYNMCNKCKHEYILNEQKIINAKRNNINLRESQ